jgi:phospholipid-binding lipoprotein MlaA
MNARPSPDFAARAASRLGAAVALCAALTVAGCASVAPDGRAAASAQVDPFERWNRKVFAFNEAVDEAVLEPVATLYRDVVPSFVRTGIGNFFGNVGDVWSTVNHLLQGKAESAVQMGFRVLTNTFLGLGGVLDPATELKLVKQPEDFGQTLGRWGMGPGAFLVLPLLGPSTVRDGLGLPLDMYASAATHYAGEQASAVSLLQLVNLRASLLATTRLLGDVSLDKYSFIRDGYLARRLDQVHDGAPPLEKFEDVPDDPPSKK